VFANAQWRAPEEQFINGDNSVEPLSEKIDVYALGNIFFRIIAGHDPWKEYKVDGRISSEDQDNIARHKRVDGEIPDFLDPAMVDTSIPEIKAIYDVMFKCFQKLPNDRPTAIEIERELSQAYTILAKQSLSSAK
jgi:serine/threonine protein kinase